MHNVTLSTSLLKMMMSMMSHKCSQNSINKLVSLLGCQNFQNITILSRLNWSPHVLELSASLPFNYLHIIFLRDKQWCFQSFESFGLIECGHCKTTSGVPLCLAIYHYNISTTLAIQNYQKTSNNNSQNTKLFVNVNAPPGKEAQIVDPIDLI